MGRFQAILTRQQDKAALQAIVLQAGRRTGVYMETLFSEYPPEPTGDKRALPLYYTRVSKRTGQAYQSKFKSEAQQGWFFANLPTLNLPRVRTGLLGRSWTSEAVLRDGQLIVRAGTNVWYATFVIGTEQSWYHANNDWLNVPKELDRRYNEIMAFFLRTFFALYQAYLLRGTTE